MSKEKTYRYNNEVIMKKIIFAFIMVFAFIGCDSPSAPSVDTDDNTEIEQPVENIPVDSFEANFPKPHITHGLYLNDIRAENDIFKIIIGNKNYNVKTYRISYNVVDKEKEDFERTIEFTAEFNSTFYIQISRTYIYWTLTITKIEAMVNSNGDFQTIWEGSFVIDQNSKG